MKLSEEDACDVMAVYWFMLQVIEGQVNPDTCHNAKLEVDAAYRLWNRVMKTDVKPRWEK